MTILGYAMSAIGGVGVVGFSFAAVKERISSREKRFLMVAAMSLLLVFVGITLVKP